MEKQLIGRGVLSGAVAGFVAFVFARIYAEPVIQRAIDYEDGRGAALAKLTGEHEHEHEIFTRAVQGSLGLGAGMILFGAAMGALVAVAYAVAIGRTGRIRPLQLGYLVPAFGFIGFFAVPFAKYPSNPPAIGHEETIRTRAGLYLLVMAASLILLFLAVYLGQKLHARYSVGVSTLVAGLGYLVVMGILFAAFPPLGHLSANVAEYGRHATETPLPVRDDQGTIVYPGFPADVLAQFRVYAIAAQVILWGGIALIFAPLAARVLAPAADPQTADLAELNTHTPPTRQN